MARYLPLAQQQFFLQIFAGSISERHLYFVALIRHVLKGTVFVSGQLPMSHTGDTQMLKSG